MKPTATSKQPRGARRKLVPLEPIDAKDGPKMLALPSDRHRAFVRALYTVRPGWRQGEGREACGLWLRTLDTADHGDDREPPVA